jgi:hypothetical protein
VKLIVQYPLRDHDSSSNPPRPAAGGGHGGLGGSSVGVSASYPGPPGGIYGSMTVPRLRGSGGGTDRHDTNNGKGGYGGGRLELTARVLWLDGVIEARGGDGSGTGTYYIGASGGSGGSILINTTTLHGGSMAVIDASGGVGHANTDHTYVSIMFSFFSHFPRFHPVFGISSISLLYYCIDAEEVVAELRFSRYTTTITGTLARMVAGRALEHQVSCVGEGRLVQSFGTDYRRVAAVS